MYVAIATTVNIPIMYITKYTNILMLLGITGS